MTAPSKGSRSSVYRTLFVRLVCLLLTACSLSPPEPPRCDGGERHPVNGRPPVSPGLSPTFER
jgi:hypothetical protein